MDLAPPFESIEIWKSQEIASIHEAGFEGSLVKIYTKTGDDGTTGLIGGSRTSKDSRRIECIGRLDELNSAIGYVRVLTRELPFEFLLTRVQNVLFEIGSEVASPGEHARSQQATIGTIIEDLERSIDVQTRMLPELQNFILPGGCELSARLHLARCGTRAAERELIRFSQEEQVRPELLAFLNRLSDWLFVCARSANHDSGTIEPIWTKED